MNDSEDFEREDFSISESLTNQESLFKAAAIKCAKMEEELAIVFRRVDFNGKQIIIPEEGVHLDNANGTVTISSIKEDIKGIEEGQFEGAVRIGFSDGIADHAQLLGINTNRELTIGLHTDEPSLKEFNEYVKKDPLRADNAYTHYYFNMDGSYKKSSGIPAGVEIKSSRKPLWSGKNMRVYESEMTPGDFEIAGQVLQMLTVRLKNTSSDIQLK